MKDSLGSTFNYNKSLHTSVFLSAAFQGLNVYLDVYIIMGLSFTFKNCFGISCPVLFPTPPANIIATFFILPSKSIVTQKEVAMLLLIT